MEHQNKFQDRLQFFTTLSGNTAVSLPESQARNSPSTPRANRNSKENLANSPRVRPASSIGGSFTNVSYVASVSTPPHAVNNNDGLSVRDRIARHGAANATNNNSSSVNGSHSSVNTNEGSHHPAPQRPSQGARSAPYTRRPSVGRRTSITSSRRTDQDRGDMDVDTDGAVAVSMSTTVAQPQPAAASASVGFHSQSQSMQQASTSARRSNEQLAPKFGAPSSNNKCHTCNKTVYVVEQITIDNHVFHKGCFKCTHCKGTLKMGNLASLDGQYYCKPHFKQLFKLKGNYSEGFGKEEPKRAWLQEHGGASPKQG